MHQGQRSNGPFPTEHSLGRAGADCSRLQPAHRAGSERYGHGKAATRPAGSSSARLFFRDARKSRRPQKIIRLSVVLSSKMVRP